MRLILAVFNNVLGLNGYINFVKGTPILIYGENIAGKSNIINMLRYCLIPPKRGKKKGYTEEKRLKKNEILLKKSSAGIIEIYFEQAVSLYKLEYHFIRKSGVVRQKQKLFQAKKIELPTDDDERLSALRRIDWKKPLASSIGGIKEKIIELKIYPEVLDILISPSNVRNFSEAINGKVVRVPEVVSAKISKIHGNIQRYLNNLKTLNGVLTLEKRESEERIKELREEFQKISKNLPEIKVEEIFTHGKTAKNLQNLQSFIAKKLEFMPSEVAEMRNILTLLSSEKYEIWSESISKALKTLSEREKLKSLLDKKENLAKASQIVNRWEVIFGQLPPEKKLEGVLTFKIPSYKKFDFKVFSNPNRLRFIFLSAEKMKKLVYKANKVCDKYKIPLKTSSINKIITKYKQLDNMLKNPIEPKGDPALISKWEDKVVVSISLNLALKKEEYLKGVEPTPFIHRPKRINKKEFEKKISGIRKKIREKVDELRKAKKNLADGKKLLRNIKSIRNTLTQELANLKNNLEENEKEFTGLIQKCYTDYQALCRVFKLKPEKIDFSTRKKIETSFKLISKSCKAAQEIFTDDLTKQLQNYPEIIKKYDVKKLTPDQIVGKIKEEFKKKIEKITELQQKYKEINEWILTNINQLKSIEDRDKTREIISISLFIAWEILSRMYEKTDLEKIIEQLADKIEENVKNAYSKIFPEDESFKFEHLGKGAFLSTINNEPITHPSGSQRAAISAGIMISLADTFRLPMILDEAFDRIDVKRLKFFVEYITGLTNAPSNYQICLAAYTSFNIEKNPEIIPFVNQWKNYLVERKKILIKNIKPLGKFPVET